MNPLILLITVNFGKPLNDIHFKSNHNFDQKKAETCEANWGFHDLCYIYFVITTDVYPKGHRACKLGDIN